MGPIPVSASGICVLEACFLLKLGSYPDHLLGCRWLGRCLLNVNVTTFPPAQLQDLVQLFLDLGVCLAWPPADWFCSALAIPRNVTMYLCGVVLALYLVFKAMEINEA